MYPAGRIRKFFSRFHCAEAGYLVAKTGVSPLQFSPVPAFALRSITKKFTGGGDFYNAVIGLYRGCYRAADLAPSPDASPPGWLPILVTDVSRY